MPSTSTSATKPGLSVFGLWQLTGKGKALLDDEKVVVLQVGKTVWENSPRKMRTELWLSSLQRRGIGLQAQSVYNDLVDRPITEEAALDIDKDLGRTFPSTKRFASPAGQQSLRRVLRAYAAYDPEVGYCQGMNFLAGLLLMYLPSESHAFGALVMLMEERNLRKYFSVSMSLLQVQLWQLSRLMSPSLCSHLEEWGVAPVLYAASWLMTCFSADFPISFSARIMDVVMADRCDAAMLKVACTLLQHAESRLTHMTDMEAILTYLKLQVPSWPEAQLHDILTEAFTTPWSSRQLAVLGTEEGAETVEETSARLHTSAKEARQPAVRSAPASTCTSPALSRTTSRAGLPPISPVLAPPPPSSTPSHYRRPARTISEGSNTTVKMMSPVLTLPKASQSTPDTGATTPQGLIRMCSSGAPVPPPRVSPLHSGAGDYLSVWKDHLDPGEVLKTPTRSLALDFEGQRGDSCTPASSSSRPPSTSDNGVSPADGGSWSSLSHRDPLAPGSGPAVWDSPTPTKGGVSSTGGTPCPPSSRGLNSNEGYVEKEAPDPYSKSIYKPWTSDQDRVQPAPTGHTADRLNMTTEVALSRDDRPLIDLSEPDKYDTPSHDRLAVSGADWDPFQSLTEGFEGACLADGDLSSSGTHAGPMMTSPFAVGLVPQEPNHDPFLELSTIVKMSGTALGALGSGSARGGDSQTPLREGRPRRLYDPT